MFFNDIKIEVFGGEEKSDIILTIYKIRLK